MSKKLPAHINRLRTNHSRYPWALVLKIDGKNAVCKYCGRTPLVGNFDFLRTIDGKDEACCYECFQDHRGDETNKDSLMHLGYIMSGLSQSDSEFPLAPEKGKPKLEEVGTCAGCGKPVYYNNETMQLEKAYNELLRGVRFHDKRSCTDLYYKKVAPSK